MPTTNVWRILVAAGGVLILVGGSMHPDGATAETIEATLADMIVGHEGQWVAAHGLYTVGLGFLCLGFAGARRARAWPTAEQALPFAIGAAALATVDLAIHTLSVIDGEELAAGAMPTLTKFHLVLSVVGGVVFGVALALLAWRVMKPWSGGLLLIGAAGILGGVATALAVPVVIATDSDALFPIAGIATTVWAIGAALAGYRAHRIVPEAATT
jgi:hypothetical protein